jgi:hypothetical protein
MLQFIYITWKYLIRTIAIVSFFLLLSILVAWIWLQLPSARAYFIQSIEHDFSARYHGELHIGSIDGLLPFRASIHQISVIWQEDGYQPDTLINIDRVDLSLNPFDLLSNRLSVQYLTVHAPHVRIKYDPDLRFITINRVFQSRETVGTPPENVVRKLDVLAPFLQVENGSVDISFRDTVNTPTIFVTGLDASSFVEFSDQMQFIDLQYLRADVSALMNPLVQLKGQVYHDATYLEFNGFSLWNGSNKVSLNGEIKDVDILSSDRRGQLAAATYGLGIDSTRIRLSDYSSFFPVFSNYIHELQLDTKISGNTDLLRLDAFKLQYGLSQVEVVGEVSNVLDPQNFEYIADLRGLNFNSGELSELAPWWDHRLAVFDQIVTSGRVSGGRYHSDIDLSLRAGSASIKTSGKINWHLTPSYALNVQTINLDLAQIYPDFYPNSRITSLIRLEGTGTDPDLMNIDLDLTVNNSIVGNYEIDQLELVGNYSNNALQGELKINHNNAVLSGFLTAQLSEIPVWSLRGDFLNVDLREYLLTDQISPTDIDFEISVEATGINVNDITGRINLDVTRAVVGGDTLATHQFYADLSDTEDGQRELRFTSTLLDFNVRGDLNPELIKDMSAYWKSYVYRQLDKELFLEHESDDVLSVPATLTSDARLDILFDFQVKNAALVRSYFNNLPYLDVDLAAQGTVQATRDRILFSSVLEGSAVTVGDISLKNYSVVNTTSLQYGRPFKEFSLSDLVVRATELQSSRLNVRDLFVSASVLNDSTRVMATVGSIGEADYGGSVRLHVTLRDSLIDVALTDFKLGNRAYEWNLVSPANLRYDDTNRLQIDGFLLANNEQQLAINGAYSSFSEDLIRFDIRSLDVSAISDLFVFRSSFSGILDGTFETSMLFVDPVISGNFTVDHLKLDGRTIGDVEFSSAFNSSMNRFDVDLQILTDPVKHAQYLATNRDVGQNIQLKGWINAPGNPIASDTLYYFDVQLDQIDAWILTPIIPSVFVSTEGIARGSGSIWGTPNYLDFTGRFQVDQIRAVPEFLLTNYTLSGEVEISRKKGVNFNNIAIRDSRGGTGILRGNIGFNDFKTERPFNVVIDLNQLEFLNNGFDSDVPFYGRVFGSGSVSLTGSNQAPFLRTLIPITTTSDSRLSIPLLDETSVEEQARFIQFVRSFSELNQTDQGTISTQQVESSGNRFMETVTMDLQFIAPPNSSVQLVFDPLTGEILNAQGSGRIRLTIEDQNFQMFGSFNVNGGEYVFVAGDIFVRRFQLRSGGTISWDGDPTNARLNITTAYRSRPNVGVLSPALGNLQTRIPVDLMLVITGTIQSIENNFYFEFPNATDVSQNASALSILNSEDQKLIQATSLLFTGGFIPVGGSGQGQTGELGASLQARAGQVGLSQLLSNQINAILNSSLSNLDIDLNLTGFDQADIGIALRLFDDRLILRGESQYSSAAETGAETTLGDLGITYRINRALSVEVFHRRDPTLRSIVGNQTQVESINGVGLEAQIQFNTWSEFRNRIWANLRRFFGTTESIDQTES